MQLNMNGIAVVVEDDQIAKLVQMHIRGDAANAPRDHVAIGDEWTWHGGIYAGIARGRDGDADYRLFVGPELAADGVTWQDAMQRAEALDHNGVTDWALPTRHEQALMYANVPDLFQPKWYWSGEQHASDSLNSWCQFFGNGSQTSNSKGNQLRARAVRRSPL